MNNKNNPLLLRPSGKDYLWGGKRLNDEFAKGIPMSPLAETWECSVHPDGPSYVVNKEFENKTLREVLEQHTEFLGTKHTNGFPLLIKFIDAKEDLSIQVHPDDEYAFKYENGERGKTEMWYVLDATKNATLIYGLKRDITKEELLKAITDNTLTKYLQYVPVKKGDVFFIKSGTIHAIGAGIQICEIQQNSNTTYRVYDFGRVGKDGKPRELHIQKAIDVSNLSPIESDFKPCGPEEKNGDCDTVRLATCEYFTTYESTLNGTTTLHVDDESFGSILLIEGNATIENDGTTLEVNKGDSVFIDANSGDVKITGKCQWIYSRV